MFHPEASKVPRTPKVGSNYLNPLPESFKVDGMNVCTQKRDAGGSYTTAWKFMEMLYSSLHVSNQMELASTLSDYIIKMNDELIAAVPEKWQYNSAGLSRCTGPDMQESILAWPSPESPERSNLTYLCYYLWEFYRTSMDEEYLRNHLFPLLRRSINLMLHEVTVDKNGFRSSVNISAPLMHRHWCHLFQFYPYYTVN